MQIDRDLQILRRVLDGETFQQVADSFGMSRANIQRIIYDLCRSRRPDLVTTPGSVSIAFLRRNKDLFFAATQPWENFTPEQLLDTPFADIEKFLPLPLRVKRAVLYHGQDVFDREITLRAFLCFSRKTLLSWPNFGPNSLLQLVCGLQLMGLAAPADYHD